MIKNLFKIKKSKALYSLFIAGFAVLLFDIFCVTFNVIQIAVASSNSAKISSIFIVVNIIAVALNLLVIASIFIYLLLKRYSKLNIWFVTLQ